VIGGEVARAALRLASLLVLLSAATVVYQDRSSAEFIVSIMALVVSVTFLAVVLVFMRLGTSRLPPRRDNAGSKDYTEARSEGRSSKRGRET
jgi:hypothetical protein